MDKYNNLIVDLMVIQGYARDLHYNVADYSIHLFADRVNEGLDDFIDEIKETCLLAKGIKVLRSYEYYQKVSHALIIDEISLQSLKKILLDVLTKIEYVGNISVGDSDLLGRIGNKLQNSLGILNILLKDNNNV